MQNQEFEVPNVGHIFRNQHHTQLSSICYVLNAGDFWHERGAIPVTPLNLVLGELQKIRSPMLMLVGNHDQVNHRLSFHAHLPILLSRQLIFF